MMTAAAAAEYISQHTIAQQPLVDEQLSALGNVNTTDMPVQAHYAMHGDL